MAGPTVASHSAPAESSADAARDQRSRGRARLLRALGVVLGACGLVGLWAWGSQHQNDLILPSPLTTWHALVELIENGDLFAQLGRTSLRAVTGVAMGFGIGVAWGSARGLSSWVSSLTQPLLSSLMALPPVVLVALGMVWLGPGGQVTRLVVTFVALPLIVVAVAEAVRAVDRDLLEMARVFELSRWAIARHIVMPAVASPVLAATSVTIGQALRVAVMAELLAAADGVGSEIALARSNLETADLFAWALVLVIVVVAVEALVLRPISARLLRWRSPG